MLIRVEAVYLHNNVLIAIGLNNVPFNNNSFLEFKLKISLTSQDRQD